MNNFPDLINQFIDNKKIKLITNYHVSGDLVYDINNEYILKISTNKELLLKEKNNNDLLDGKIPVCKSIIYVEDDKYAYYIKTKLIGKSLCEKPYINNPKKVVKLLSEAIKLFHTTNMIHGDFCLPNILVRYNKIVGFIDLGRSGFGDYWEDYAWSIWSLEYNLNSNEYTKEYVELLGITFDKEKYDKYIDK